MAKIDEGVVPVTVDGTTYQLKCNLGAMRALSGMYGGLAKVREGLAAQNVDVFAAVIRWGADLKDKDMNPLQNKIYRTGVGGELLGGLITYVLMLGNGGKPFDINKDTEETEGDAGNL
jgi:hypothetical protein